jgi:hypothetical protein
MKFAKIQYFLHFLGEVYILLAKTRKKVLTLSHFIGTTCIYEKIKVKNK